MKASARQQHALFLFRLEEPISSCHGSSSSSSSSTASGRATEHGRIDITLGSAAAAAGAVGKALSSRSSSGAVRWPLQHGFSAATGRINALAATMTRPSVRSAFMDLDSVPDLDDIDVNPASALRARQVFITVPLMDSRLTLPRAVWEATRLAEEAAADPEEHATHHYHHTDPGSPSPLLMMLIAVLAALTALRILRDVPRPQAQTQAQQQAQQLAVVGDAGANLEGLPPGVVAFEAPGATPFRPFSGQGFRMDATGPEAASRKDTRASGSLARPAEGPPSLPGGEGRPQNQ
mmetsp:Transcript_34297/g.78167  ORF Transcript_34297/g.78167 Transcript_34297/m.78167 type:complete len:292 (-) Transcript_34297:39-914(-)